VKKSAAVPQVMLSEAKHLDFTMTYVTSRSFAALRMTEQRRFFTSSADLCYNAFPDGLPVSLRKVLRAANRDRRTARRSDGLPAPVVPFWPRILFQDQG